jgi:hypothetical protein
VDETGLQENLKRILRNLRGERPGRRPAEGGAAAMDASRASVQARFPNAARINAGGGGNAAFCFVNGGQPQYRPRPQVAQDTAGMSPISFLDRFPGARRIQK